jgi:hypothetical protein
MNTVSSVDVATIFFNSVTEIELLKLQALSFSRIDNINIGRILVFYNDQVDDEYPELLAQIRSDLLPFYPESLREKLEVLCWRDVDKALNPVSDWYSQQAAKLQLATFCDSPHYIIFDSKNHFIKPVFIEDFFADNGRPWLRLQKHGDALSIYYQQCLSFFGCPNPFDNGIFCTAGTPFVFNRSAVLGLIEYIFHSENSSILEFIQKSKRYTEFFLYFSYLCYSSQTDLHEYDFNVRFAGLGSVDPSSHPFNTIDHLLGIVESYPLCKTLGIHRCYPQYLSQTDWDKLVSGVYSKVFSQFEIEQLYRVLEAKDYGQTVYRLFGLPLDFSPSEYKRLNPDLDHLSDSLAARHYKTQGVNEGRAYSSRLV